MESAGGSGFLMACDEVAVDILQEIRYTNSIKLFFPQLSVLYVRRGIFPFGSSLCLLAAEEAVLFFLVPAKR